VNATNLASHLLEKKSANKKNSHGHVHIFQNGQNKTKNDSNTLAKNPKITLQLKALKGSSSIRNKLIILVIMAGLIPTITSTYINLKKVETELFQTNKDRLSSLKEEKKRQIENYFDQIKKQAIIFSSNFTIISAMEDFTMGFVNAFEESKGNLEAGYEKKLRDRYRYQVKMTSGAENLDVKKWYPYGKTSQILQAQYISENKFPIGEKHKLDSADDGSLYSEAHQEYHPYIRQLLETFGYYDIFLVEPETGFIVYSVYKEIDFATSLKTGPYANTAIGKAFKRALKSSDRDTVFMEDFEPYAPSYNAPAAFISSSVYSGDRLIGVLIFQVPIEKIDNVMTSRQAWKDVGLGESGEVYLVGQDFKLRSNSRFLIENPEEYFKQLQTLKVKPKIIERSKALKSSIGMNEINTLGTRAALGGESGFSVIKDYRGINVLSAYSPLEILGLKWGILAEIDEAEALAVRDELRNEAIFSSLIAIILLSILGAIIASRTAKPIQKIVSVAQNISLGNLKQPKLKVNSKDEIGQLSTMFNQMIHSLNLFVKQADDLSVGNLQSKVVFKNLNKGMVLDDASNFVTDEFKDSKGDLADAFNNLNCEMRKLTVQAIAIANDDLNNPILKEKIPGELGEAFYKMTQKMLWFCEQATIIANNDLKNKSLVDDNDGTLGHSMAIMVKNLRETNERIEEINAMVVKSSRSLTQEAERLGGVSSQMSQGAEKTASQANIVSNSANHVSDNIQTVASGTEQMGASIKEISSNATQAANFVSNAVSIANTANQTVSQLGESSSEVGAVVKDINAIAEQTNLLALNATIEAARAGEAGKGFAVVANEVKELAKQTSQATENIGHRVLKIQDDTKDAVDTIGKITSTIDQINDSFHAIASAVEEQSATALEMSRNVNEAAKGGSEIAQNIENVAKAAQDTSSGALDTKKTANQISKMANDLYNLVK